MQFLFYRCAAMESITCQAVFCIILSFYLNWSLGNKQMETSLLKNGNEMLRINALTIWKRELNRSCACR